jgi:hypothetical protein
MSSATPNTWELAARDNEGLHVLSLWHPREDALTVSVGGQTSGDRLGSRLPAIAPSTPSITPSPTPPNESK